MGFWGVFRKNASPELLKEQAPGIMMGPFPLAIYCLFVVTLGQITINQTRADGAESDFYPGWVCKPDSVIRGEDDDLMFNLFIGFYLPNIFFSYLILVTFIWSFIGFRVEININYFMKDAGEKNYALLLPFTKLSWLAGVYVFLIPCHFIVMLAGSIINTLAAPCIPDNLTVLAFSTFMVVMYWIIIVFKIVNQCVKTFGKQIGEGLKNVAKQAISKRNHELEFLANEFRKFEQADGHMDAGDLESLLVTLGVDLDNDAVEEARSKMDADESGTIELNEFMRWYQLEVGLSDKKRQKSKVRQEQVRGRRIER